MPWGRSSIPSLCLQEMLGGGVPEPAGRGPRLWGQIHGLELQSCQDEFREKPKVERELQQAGEGNSSAQGLGGPPPLLCPPSIEGRRSVRRQEG